MKRIVLTGASGGIGRALAGRLAGPGVSMLLLARDEERLRLAAQDAREKGAEVEWVVRDVTDRGGMAAALEAWDAAAPVDLVIANAGVTAGSRPGGAPETPQDARRVWETNFVGVLNTVEPLLPALRARRGARIALMSSMAALRPQPDLAAYSASKAAVRAWGVALRGGLRAQGASVSVICPGFVASPMSARHKGFKPFEISAARAAEIIARGLARRDPFITFPAPLTLLTWLDNRLPAGVSDWFARGFRAEIAPDGAPQGRD